MFLQGGEILKFHRSYRFIFARKIPFRQSEILKFTAFAVASVALSHELL